jgi:hypothetical protein
LEETVYHTRRARQNVRQTNHDETLHQRTLTTEDKSYRKTQTKQPVKHSKETVQEPYIGKKFVEGRKHKIVYTKNRKLSKWFTVLNTT